MTRYDILLGKEPPPVTDLVPFNIYGVSLAERYIRHVLERVGQRLASLKLYRHSWEMDDASVRVEQDADDPTLLHTYIQLHRPLRYISTTVTINKSAIFDDINEALSRS
jgi:hypothetical protein